MSKRRIFISDVHASSQGIGNYSHDYHWLSDQQIANLASFLQFLLQAKPDEVVILGDLLDNWVCPIDMVPPSMRNILTAAHNQPIIDGLNHLLDAGVKVIYTAGNHDQMVTAEDLRQVMPKLTVGDGWLSDCVYMDNRIHAEHGGSQTMFNAPDPQHDPRQRLPLGYFITRVVTTRTAGRDKRIASGADISTTPSRRCSPRRRSRPPCSKASSKRRASPSRLPSSCPTARASPPPRSRRATPTSTIIGAPAIPASALAYAASWPSSTTSTTWPIRSASAAGRTSSFSATATHRGYKDTWFVDDRIYANTGAWCEEEDLGSFVEIVTTRKEHIVRVCEWDGRVRKVSHQETLPK